MIDFDGLNASFRLLQALLGIVFIALIALFLVGIVYGDKFAQCFLVHP